MSVPAESNSARIHDSLDHPIIDADGHSIEYGPLLEEYIREFTGPKGVDRYRSKGNPWYSSEVDMRRRLRMHKPTWGLAPTAGTVNYITTIVPALLEERLGEMGIDFSILLPSPGRVGVPHMKDDDLRQGLCRALNTYQADVFRPHARFMTPAAVIPMHTPTEAIEELDHAVNDLGFKAISMAGHSQRSVDHFSDGSAVDSEYKNSEAQPEIWWDSFGLDSEFDYDPVWQRCLELGVTPAFHSGSAGLGSRRMYSNSIYNHIGHFSAAAEATCKALFLGGVTRRFPELHFAFLECGVGWAASLLNDLVGHWSKRNIDAVQRLNPANLDHELAAELFRQYAPERMLQLIERIDELANRLDWVGEERHPGQSDEFAVAGVFGASDVVARFVPNFYFGCEGDDPMNGVAFDSRFLPDGVALNAVYGSDIGHWDVPDLHEVLEEAYELVERGTITSESFRAFVFENPVRLHATGNPAFFKGTSVEAAATQLMS